jgi:carboxymethylenebutenolidase
MTDIKKVSEQFSAAGQITPEELEQAAKEGFKSIVNLRYPQETGFQADEQEQALAAGLDYTNIPLNPSEPNQELVDKAIREIKDLPKPILIHCAAGARASAVALIATSIQAGLTPEEITAKAKEINLKLDQPHLKQFLEQQTQNKAIDTEVRTNQIKIPNGDLQIDAYQAEPLRQGTFPAVIVIQEIFGVNIHIREVTQRLAKQGYVAIAPAIFQRIAPGFESGYTPEDIQIGRKYKEQTKANEILSDIQATIAYLKTLPNVNGDAIGSIGFCFGGHIVYLAATLPEIKATASFYGGGIVNSTPGGGAPTITRTPDIKGTIYAFFGTEDAGIPLEQTQQIEAELEKYQIPHQVFRYPGEHGFFCNHRGSYNALSAADAWLKVKELFEKQLQAKV